MQVCVEKVDDVEVVNLDLVDVSLLLFAVKLQR